MSTPMIRVTASSMTFLNGIECESVMWFPSDESNDSSILSSMVLNSLFIGCHVYARWHINNNMIDYCGKLSNNIFCCKFDALSEKQWARWFNPEHGIDNNLVTNCHWEIIIQFWYPCVDSLPFLSQILTAWPNRTSRITVRLISIIPILNMVFRFVWFLVVENKGRSFIIHCQRFRINWWSCPHHFALCVELEFRKPKNDKVLVNNSSIDFSKW